MTKKLNIGCGMTITDGWINIDNSPAIKLANSPLKYSIVKLLGLLKPEQISNIEWNKANRITWGDATKKLLFRDAEVDCIYTSHMLEHFSREAAKKFLKEAFRVLAVGGVLRVVVPDISIAIEKYNASVDADDFMEGILVAPPPIKTFKEKVLLLAGGYRHHQWMYDGQSLSKLFRDTGFQNVSVLKPGETNIVDAGSLNLSERSEQSVYVEGVKSI